MSAEGFFVLVMYVFTPLMVIVATFVGAALGLYHFLDSGKKDTATRALVFCVAMVVLMFVTIGLAVTFTNYFGINEILCSQNQYWGNCGK